MLKVRKLLCMMLVLGLVFSLMAGCTTKEATKEDAKTETSEKETESQPEELKPVTLKFLALGPGKQQDAEKVWDEFNKKLSEEYLPNTKVEFEVIPSGEYRERWQLMIAGGEEIDIAWTGWFIPYVEEIAKGAYLPLDDLIDQYAPAIREELPAWVLEKARVDGKIYSIPCYQMMSQTRVAMKTDRELAKRYLDVENALTVFSSSKHMTKEKYEVIEDYVEKLKENGELRDGIATSGYFMPYHTGYERILDPAYINPHSNEPFKVISLFDIPDFKLMLDTDHDWFNKGYIRQDILTASADELRQSQNVVWYDWIGHNQDEADTISYGFDILNVPVFDYYYLPNSPSATSLTIPRTSKNPERAMMLLELLNTKKGSEIYNLLTWGLEGEHYNNISENRIETIHYAGIGNAESPYGLFKWAMGNTFNSWLTQAETDGNLEFIETEMHGNAIQSPIMGFNVDSDPIRTELAQIAAVRKEYAGSNFLPDYETRYEEMVEKIKNAGLERVINEIQKQLDEWVQANDKN